ncbi:uncharacterized protein LOC125758465 [Rhipicephalus sanguineus]|uniref:uncharacterized protein LOC125758465 n=1 Tax=Rhipicephalus sanguineus TaxID=34632 RepID=UPI0020C2593E|nr:uncharacterized protein LOC125758465 [Rhipicephalus sanguineus]
MFPWTFALALNLVLVVNAATISDLREMLLANKIWVVCRNYVRILYAFDYECDYFVPNLVVIDKYHIEKHYKYSGKWKSETLKGYLYPEKNNTRGPRLKLWSSFHEDDSYEMIYWDRYEGCAIMKRGKGKCEMFVRNKYIDYAQTNCYLKVAKLCGAYCSDKVYTGSCKRSGKSNFLFDWMN